MLKYVLDSSTEVPMFVAVAPVLEWDYFGSSSNMPSQTRLRGEEAK